MSIDRRTFVIVGAGLAGAAAAQALREEGFDGRVVLLGAEPDRPYHRPPLSKEYVRGEVGRDKVYVHPARFYADHEIELRAGEEVVGIDAGRTTVTLGSGEVIGFDRLLLATGVRPRRLAVSGSDLRGIHYLRTLADSDGLRARLNAGGRLVVVGAGWVGTEVAASARQMGLDVTVVNQLSVPLERVLGIEAGGVFRDIHLDHGVTMRTGTGVASFEGGGTVERVRTRDGHVIDCAAVVVGIGAQPRTELAAVAGLAVENGILVDGRLQTNVPGIFAAGDVAAQLHPLLGRLRVEHWATAREQGMAAARAMLGGRKSYDLLPYFFSDQYDVRMEYTGRAEAWDSVVYRGDPAGREFLAFWLQAGRVTAGMSVNMLGVTEEIGRLIRSGRRVDVRRLADPQVPLADLLPLDLTEPLVLAR